MNDHCNCQVANKVYKVIWNAKLNKIQKPVLSKSRHLLTKTTPTHLSSQSHHSVCLCVSKTCSYETSHILIDESQTGRWRKSEWAWMIKTWSGARLSWYLPAPPPPKTNIWTTDRLRCHSLPETKEMSVQCQTCSYVFKVTTDCKNSQNHLTSIFNHESYQYVLI